MVFCFNVWIEYRVIVTHFIIFHNLFMLYIFVIYQILHIIIFLKKSAAVETNGQMSISLKENPYFLGRTKSLWPKPLENKGGPQWLIWVGYCFSQGRLWKVCIPFPLVLPDMQNNILPYILPKPHSPAKSWLYMTRDWHLVDTEWI